RQVHAGDAHVTESQFVPPATNGIGKLLVVHRGAVLGQGHDAMITAMHNLSDRLYSAEQVRRLDHIAITELGIPGHELMARAGRGAFEELRRLWPAARRIAVLCGGGNNGGDGYVV